MTPSPQSVSPVCDLPDCERDPAPGSALCHSHDVAEADVDREVPT